MIPKVLRILEYDKITEMLAGECCAAMTRDRARALKPLTNRLKISEELNDTDEAVQVLMRKGAPPLGNFYDISGIVHLAAMDGQLDMRQLLQVAYNLGCARRTAEFLSSDLPELPVIDGLASAVSVLRKTETEIDRCILSEDEMADSASPELRRIRNSIARKQDEVRSKIQQIVNSADNRQFLQDAIVTQRQGRYVIPVKAEHRSRLAGIVHDQSSSGATLFIEPQAIVNINNELRELELAEKKEILRILKELSAMVGEDEIKINANQNILAKLDFMFAKGRLACNMKGSKPVINDDGYVRIRKGRHPLIDPKKVVPIDIEIGGDYSTLVITGPNTGGKTVTLKTLGLLCLMAQAGLFVPAGDGTTMPVFKKVYADIGDEQSIEQSLSTFSSHMTNIVGIVKGAGQGSLVLLDELGAGTDPTEGAALAISILDKLYEKGSTTAATTHYTELKKYAISTPGVQNASMEFDVETLSPTYRLMIGLPGKSNAFLISQKLGLQEDIIDRARNLLEGGDIAFEDVISQIEDDRKKAEAERAEAEEIKRQFEKQKKRMDELEAKMQAQKERVMEEAREEARELVDEARAEVDEIRKAVNEAVKNAQSAQAHDLNRSIEDSRRRLKERRNTLVSKPEVPENTAGDEKPSAEDIKPGVRVNVLSVGQKAVVLTAPDDRGDFFVQAGQIKLEVNLSGVTLVQENVTDKQREKTKYSRMYMDKSKTTPMSVNVVGKTLDDAEMIVDKYIDDAFMAGLGTVSVIHGRGTYVLRDGLRKMLKKNKNVESVRAGGYKEGGDGVTIVTLRRN